MKMNTLEKLTVATCVACLLGFCAVAWYAERRTAELRARLATSIDGIDAKVGERVDKVQRAYEDAREKENQRLRAEVARLRNAPVVVTTEPPLAEPRIPQQNLPTTGDKRP
jgi:hypothetical protein